LRLVLNAADFMSLALISFERCMKNLQLFYENIEKAYGILFGGRKNTAVVILTVWVYAISIIFIPYRAMDGKIGFDCENGICHVLEGKSMSKTYGYFLSSINFLPVSILLLFNIFLVCAPSLSPNPISEDQSDNVKKEVKSIYLLSTIYSLLLLPHAIIKLVPDFKGKPAVRKLLYCFYWITYIINFFLYIIFLPNMRLAMRTVWKDLSCRGAHQGSTEEAIITQTSGPSLQRPKSGQGKEHFESSVNFDSGNGSYSTEKEEESIIESTWL